METALLALTVILGLIGIYNYMRIRNLEKRTEETFIEVEKLLNIISRRFNEWK